MSNIVKLGMVFDESTVPEFGGIVLGKNGNLLLLSVDYEYLKNVTKRVCGLAFNIPNGTAAYVLDYNCVYQYYSPTDEWLMIKDEKKTTPPVYREMHYGNLSVILNKNDASYVLGEGEKIVFSVISDNETIISKELTLRHYYGNGGYLYFLNMEDAHSLFTVGENYTISVVVYSGETDITDTVTIKYPTAEEWYDVHVKYDTGV